MNNFQCSTLFTMEEKLLQITQRLHPYSWKQNLAPLHARNPCMDFDCKVSQTSHGKA